VSRLDKVCNVVSRDRAEASRADEVESGCGQIRSRCKLNDNKNVLTVCFTACDTTASGKDVLDVI
jgi:hypothetical protein